MITFITYSIEVAISLGLFYLMFFFLLRKDTFFNINRAYLLSSAMFSLLIPMIKYCKFYSKFIYLTWKLGKRKEKMFLNNFFSIIIFKKENKTELPDD